MTEVMGMEQVAQCEICFNGRKTQPRTKQKHKTIDVTLALSPSTYTMIYKNTKWNDKN